uniref:Non-specific serine/threonine protein kinase n=1 Tax=Strigamia maritima TaxID=126957 RepID=T1IL53_STRMM
MEHYGPDEMNVFYLQLKKQNLGHNLKLPGKKLFGNNFDPEFIKERREGLNEFVRRVTTDSELFVHPDVRQFLGLDKRTSNQSTISENESFEEGSERDTDEEPIFLGPTEKLQVKPTDFDFLKVIGKGSFGKVLLAKHKSDGKIFAIKVLEKKMILKRNETRHIMSERNVLLEATQHPFLVTLHYSFQTSDKLYFVLDFINGGELFFHLQRERYFPESRAQFYAAEMATALGYLHQTGIVYRDLKPENILLKFDGHIVLTDFGLCKEGIYSDNKTSTFCGTPEYLAPEVLRKQPYTKAVDWWCFGSVLYEMVYGLPPFYSRDTPEMYDNILNKPIRLRTNISVAARDILLKLLQKNPDMRLGSSDADVVEICEHEFFKSIKWSDLVEKRIPPPYIPDVQDRMDLKNIDPEFTREPVPASIRVQRNTVSASVMDADNAFEGFSYR